MAISTVAGIGAAIAAGKSYKTSWNKVTGAAAYTAGRWYDTFTLVGQPPAGVYTGGLAATQLIGSGATPTVGKISIGENVAADVRHLINIEMMTAVANGTLSWLMLVDLLLFYVVDMNQAAAQTCTNALTLPRYTDGVGVQMFLEALATTGAGAITLHTTDFLYTNSGDTPNKIVPPTVACTASAIVPHLLCTGTAINNFGPFIPLANGDKGVKLVSQFRLSGASGTASTAALVLCKPLATIPLVAANITTARDYVFSFPSMPVVQDGACLAFLLCTGGATTAATNFYGTLDFVWG